MVYDAGVDARPILSRLARAMAKTRLDAVLIGNAGAALHGAPVTTLDFDFFFRDTATNRRKLVALAQELGATVLRPYYPASSLFRVTDDDLVLQADFLGVIHGLRSYEGVRRRATTVEIDGQPLRVASLEDILKSKKAADRPRIALFSRSWKRRSMRSNADDRANAAERGASSRARQARLNALRAESERELDDLIARLLAKPMHERTHFLRRRLPGGGSAL